MGKQRRRGTVLGKATLMSWIRVKVVKLKHAISSVVYVFGILTFTCTSSLHQHLSIVHVAISIHSLLCSCSIVFRVVLQMRCDSRNMFEWSVSEGLRELQSLYQPCSHAGFTRTLEVKPEIISHMPSVNDVRVDMDYRSTYASAQIQTVQTKPKLMVFQVLVLHYSTYMHSSPYSQSCYSSWSQYLCIFPAGYTHAAKNMCNAH